MTYNPTISLQLAAHAVAAKRKAVAVDAKRDDHAAPAPAKPKRRDTNMDGRLRHIEVACRSEGRRAADEGLSIHACPYKTINDLSRRAAWLNGWSDRREVIRAKRQKAHDRASEKRLGNYEPPQATVRKRKWALRRDAEIEQARKEAEVQA